MSEAIERANMSEVVVEKTRLIETLIKNRDAHRAIFEEAMDGYQTRSIEILMEHIERIKKGKFEKVMVALPMPEDHTDDYNRALASLEWNLLDTVELSITEFDQFIRDNWRWKQEFVGTTSMYNNH